MPLTTRFVEVDRTRPEALIQTARGISAFGQSSVNPLEDPGHVPAHS